MDQNEQGVEDRQRDVFEFGDPQETPSCRDTQSPKTPVSSHHLSAPVLVFTQWPTLEHGHSSSISSPHFHLYLQTPRQVRNPDLPQVRKSTFPPSSATNCLILLAK
jgi:hypothetical protein